MSLSGLRKRWILFGLAATTLATILWAAYLFTAIWLRVRCVRELAEQAEPLPEVAVTDQVERDNPDTDRAVIWANLAWNFRTRSDSALDRLEALQRPNVATVTRHLLGLKDEPTGTFGQLQSVAFSPQGQVLAASGSNTATVRIWDAQTGAPQTGSYSFSVSATSSSSNTGQALAQLVLLDPAFDFKCFTVTDAHGERILVVTRPLPQASTDEHPSDSPPPRELLLIDMAGRIFARQPCPAGGLIGRLAEPHGQADQLVFGTRAFESDQVGTFALRVVGPGLICIVDNGELKIVRPIPVHFSTSSETQPAVPPED